MTHNNNNDSNITAAERQYESMGFYASEHPYEGGDSKREYDSGYESYDDDNSNQLCESVERLLSEACQSSWVTQLLSEQTVKDTGCETWTEFQSMLKNEEEKEDTKRREQMEEELAMEKMSTALKQKIKDDNNAKIMAILPKESRLGRLKRLREARAIQKKLKRNGWLDRKARRSRPQKNLPFGHRRNGGGKSRARSNVQAGSDAEKQQDAVIKARRALKRKQVQLAKKVTEDLRTEEFKNGSRIVEHIEIIKVEHIEVEEPEDEDEIIERQIEKDIEDEQQDHIRKMLCAQADNNAVKELDIKNKQDQKDIDMFEMMTNKRSVKLEKERVKKQDEVDNGSWTQVKINTKKEAKNDDVIDPVLLLINFTTPTSEREQQVKKGLTHLTDKTDMRKTLKRTKMCNSIMLKRKCPHGARCRYAHSVDELQVAECFFKESCNHVRKSGDEYFNCSRKKCSFRHPGESMQCYCCRLGLPMALPKMSQMPKLSVMKKQAIKVVVKKQVVKAVVTRQVMTKSSESCWNHVDEVVEVVEVEVVEVTPLPIVDNWTVKKKRVRSSGKKSAKRTSSSKKRKTKDAFCESVGTGRPCRHGAKCRFQHVNESVEKGQVILRVPKALAIKAMQSAMKRGLKNVKVVVV